MKNQNDLIFSIVSIVLAGIMVVVWWQTAPVVVKPPEPEPVQNTQIVLPTANVVMTNSLPGGSSTGGFGAPGGAGGGQARPGQPGGKPIMGFAGA